MMRAVRICFIGRNPPDDIETGSFLTTLLGGLGTVETIVAAPDPVARDDATMTRLATSRFDRFVFWQTEDIAARLLPLDLGVSILVPAPMAGGTDDFWRQFVRHRIVAMSRPLHERLQRLSIGTSYFQYFPEPGPRRERRIDMAALAAIFEASAPMSEPGADADVAFVAGQCRALGIGTLHVRAPGIAARGRTRERIDGVEVRVSGRDEGSADQRDAAAPPLFCFGPRRAEGIGATTLAAMARGQIVVAPDLPPANEHVAHLVSGLLYRPDAAVPGRLARLGADALRTISEAARRQAENGRRDWLEDEARLRSLVADDGQSWTTRDRSSHFGRAIQAAAHRRAARHG